MGTKTRMRDTGAGKQDDERQVNKQEEGKNHVGISAVVAAIFVVEAVTVAVAALPLLLLKPLPPIILLHPPPSLLLL